MILKSETYHFHQLDLTRACFRRFRASTYFGGVAKLHYSFAGRF